MSADPRTLLQRIHAAGLIIEVDGSDLLVSPADKLTEWQCAYLRTHKAAILEALQSQPANDYQPDAVTASAGAEPEPLEGKRPYRINVNDATQLVWLEPGLQPSQVLDQAKALYPDADVSLEPPSAGWLKLSDLPELLAASLAATQPPSPDPDPDRALVCCGDCQHFEPDQIGDSTGIEQCFVGCKARPWCRCTVLSTSAEALQPISLQGGNPMLILLTTGKLIKDPVKRTSATGKSYATALLSMPTDDGQTLVSCVAFSNVAEQLLSHSQGDSLSVLGKGKLSSWERDGEQKHGLALVVDRLLSPYELRSKREALSEPPRPKPAPVPELAFDDDVPF